MGVGFCYCGWCGDVLLLFRHGGDVPLNLTLIAALVSAGVAGLAGWGAAWTIQGRTIDSLKLEARDAIISQQRAARATSERLTNQITQAQAQAAIRNDRARADLELARSELDRLRESSTIAVRTATDDPAACASIVASFGDILAESRSFIQEVVSDADRCQSDLQLMHEAWPKASD